MKVISEFIKDDRFIVDGTYAHVTEGKLVFENVSFNTIELGESSFVIDEIKLKNNQTSQATYPSIVFTKNIQFKKCSFKKVFFNNILLHKDEDSNVLFEECTIDEITIKKCDFAGRFYINPQSRNQNSIVCKIKRLDIEDTVFNHNFKLHNCEVDDIEIGNTDFKKNADFFKTKFLQKNKDIRFKSINFDALALFGECEFHSTFILEYVTFKGLTHFRKSRFFDGLDLDKTNIEKEINFFDVKGLEKTDRTSQETYRIIKYNCQKIGNQIEGNKYYALELKKRKEFLDKNIKTNKLDWIVFKINWWSSRFSTNWLLTLFWIFIVGLLTDFAINSCKEEWSDVFKYISVFTLDECIKQNPLVFIANKASLGFLYYQFVTAIRKDTKK